MQDVRDLHKLLNLERIYFRHDNEANNLIFMLSMWGQHFFPDDSLADVVSTVCKQNSFCRKSVDLARDIYFKGKSIIEFEHYVENAGFKITDNLSASFSVENVKKEWREWINGGSERYISSIKVFPLCKT